MDPLDGKFDPFGVLYAAQPDDDEAEYYPATLPSGAQTVTLTEAEAEFVTSKVQEYEEQFSFQNVSDKAELDRCVIYELLHYRFGSWLLKGKEYDGRDVDWNLTQQRLRDNSAELRQLKKNLGIDKVARDRSRGEGSTHQFISNLLEYAHRFGITRNEQAVKARTLAMELISLVDRYKNCAAATDPEAERRRVACTTEDLIGWIDTVFRTEFLEIDETFKRESQQFWIRAL